MMLQHKNRYQEEIDYSVWKYREGIQFQKHTNFYGLYHQLQLLIINKLLIPVPTYIHPNSHPVNSHFSTLSDISINYNTHSEDTHPSGKSKIPKISLQNLWSFLLKTPTTVSLDHCSTKSTKGYYIAFTR